MAFISLWRESRVFNCLFLSLDCFFGLSYHPDQFCIFLINFPTVFWGLIFLSGSVNTCSCTCPASSWGTENASGFYQEKPPLYREEQQLGQRLWLLLGKHAQYVFHCGVADCFVACFSVDFSPLLLIFLFPGHSCSTLIFQRPVFEQLPATPLGTDLAFLCFLKNKYETINRKIKITQCFLESLRWFCLDLKYMSRLTHFFHFFFFSLLIHFNFSLFYKRFSPITLQLSIIKLYASWFTAANYIFAISDQSLCQGPVRIWDWLVPYSFLLLTHWMMVMKLFLSFLPQFLSQENTALSGPESHEKENSKAQLYCTDGDGGFI